jgi:hypothetical protein
MRVDPEVCAAKFDAEVQLLTSRAAMLRSLGAYVVRVEFPEIDVIVIPTRHLAFGIPLPPGQTPGGIILPNAPVAVGAPTQFQVVMAERFDVAAALTFGVRFYLDDFDMRAPSVTFHHPATWQLLRHHQIPQGMHIVNGAGLKVIHDRHPVTGRPFFCMRGIREYHEHPQHTGDEWLLYRGINILTLVTTLIRCCSTNCMPIYVLSDMSKLPRGVEWVM